ncbi:MAG: hypothetical protein A2381_13550 [Bdellovibrionales bacterium RIFOXYB1_FULL_37_110]|nr:MAG: hypothetical protein A2417_09905 [Bdellovibrionales bacterium RIFOXYC1_FULL_37_79]OFZ59431.1 MAG: hypothetical protein A2381_13550 [Bdellovibrionales bacterium RIFOXYB1_FULL_37_110]OFZ64056.1 MAG: hypothetical protein A2577_14915 [Bdellovibrionales bacterium RIFOXYD1_FULL_36_51]
MLIKINDNISIWQEFNPFDFSSNKDAFNSSETVTKLFFNKQRVAIRGRWFDVISPGELIRKRNEKDGYYRVLYIQINMESGEYYIGKANRPKWSEIKRYQGSGLKFKNKFKKSKSEFVRYFIAVCETAEETEKLEASIVTKELLSDEKCLNLVAGGGGTSNHLTIAETSQKKREYMKNHPEQFSPMLEASKKAFRSGDTPALRERNKRIKEVMSTDKYREMSRNRIKKWKDENPEEYAEARIKNREKIKTPEVQAKRRASFDKWAKEHPEEYKAWNEKLEKSRTSQKAKEKRRISLKEWRENNPLLAHANAQKRAKAAAEKRSKAVSMIDLESGKTLKEFPSLHEAARWLVETGKAKNLNCVSSISSVCLCKPCTTGYGYRKKAYGYVWRFTEEIL